MKNNTTVHTVNEIDLVIDEVLMDVPTVSKKIIRNNESKMIHYYNCPCAFDIETSSFYEGNEKRAIMYGWTMDLNGYIILGRKWEEFITVVERLSERLELSNDQRLIIYCHNFSGFEFQWLRKWLNWENIFAISERKPVYALCDLGIEFRCSYILTDYKLETVGTLLKKYPVQKLVGDLDYKKLRHSETPLTQKEIDYMVNDVRVVTHYIQEQIENEGGKITGIPLTKTGYVRRYCRNACVRGEYKFYNYRKLMKKLVLVPDEYKQLRRCFQGGFTHCNQCNADKVIENVASFDLCSAYPSVMVCEDRFPMGRGEEVNITSIPQFRENLKYYWCMFDIEFRHIYAKEDAPDHIISRSKCWNVENAQIDNGRIVSADCLRTTITGEDFDMIERFYNFDDLTEYNSIGEFRRYRTGYLPFDFVKSILELYRQKTELKDVKGMEEYYTNAKEKLNACYGMTVTDICRDEHLYSDGHWLNYWEWLDIERAKEENKNLSDDEILDKIMGEKLHKENNSFNRFLFYAWGVAVTSFVRHNILSAILECGVDYCYSDTDSVKTTNIKEHKKWFDEYNQTIEEKMKRAMDFHGLPYDYIMPKTKEGKTKLLGAFEYEGTYIRFKSLGAKRYMVQSPIKIKTKPKYKDIGHIKIRKFEQSKIYRPSRITMTVSGVQKKNAIPYLLKRYGAKNMFDVFEFGLEIPKGYTGKMTHTYIDNETAGEVTDYLGNKARYYERSSLHLENCEYVLSDTIPYVDYLRGIRIKEK